MIREDYIAIIDAYKYLNPELFGFLIVENVESFSMT